MSKNPYEIRLELLKLAQATLTEQMYNTRNALMDKYNSERENNPNTAFPDLPNMPTTAEIIAEANKLNKFVSTSD
jgi:hypothetical protein